jgi:hypothetical protein
MPLQATSGAASYDAFGGGVPVIPNYIEEVFSCFLYTGTGSAQTITNSIDLSTNGGLVWIKSRSAATNHNLFDTAQGTTKLFHSNTTAATVTDANSLTAFNTTGFTLGSGNTTGNQVNTSAATYASWTFREQPKFFDVVTYTGDGVDGRQISHNLTSEPGCIIVKRTDGVTQWRVYHRSVGSGANKNGRLNGTDAFDLATTVYSPTSTYFTVSSDGDANASGGTYVAYLFAHDAGGFGLTGTDNVISCGSFTTDGSGVATVTLGYEPQWVLWKRSSGVGDWFLVDNMRGMTTPGTFGSAALRPNSSAAEITGADYTQATATGFVANSSSSSDFIYIAIRRGPMKVPTSGTSVFSPVARTGTGATATVTNSNISYVDFLFSKMRNDTAAAAEIDRLRGNGRFLLPAYADGESNPTGFPKLDVMNGYTTDSVQNFNQNAKTFINYLFKRAPSFFDVVCLPASTSTAVTANHNLGVAPQMIIVKDRDAANDWGVYHSALGITKYTKLNTTDPTIVLSNSPWGSSTPTATTFTFNQDFMAGNGKAVVYLFATCAGVSKVGSYTGTGALQTVDCGFTSGARFVLIRRGDTGTGGAWFYYDTARGISSGDDPYLLMNTDAAEVTNTNYVDTDTTGFKVTAAAPAGLNASGGTYIFLAIA